MSNEARGILFSHLGNSHMNIYRCFCGYKVKNDSNFKKVAECCTKWKLSVIKIAESYFHICEILMWIFIVVFV